MLVKSRSPYKGCLKESDEEQSAAWRSYLIRHYLNRDNPLLGYSISATHHAAFLNNAARAILLAMVSALVLLEGMNLPQGYGRNMSPISCLLGITAN